MWLLKLLCGESKSQTHQHSHHIINAVFKVSGHWRKQWVGSSNNGTRKAIQKWINPFIKGAMRG